MLYVCVFSCDGTFINKAEMQKCDASGLFWWQAITVVRQTVSGVDPVPLDPCRNFYTTDRISQKWRAGKQSEKMECPGFLNNER